MATNTPCLWLNKVGSNVARRTAISYFYRLNPFTGKPVTDESLMNDQFGNTEDVRKKHYKDGSVTIEEARVLGMNGLITAFLRDCMDTRGCTHRRSSMLNLQPQRLTQGNR